MTPGVAACRWLIQGRVQGVGFRWSTARRANAIGVAGWVRNLPDGQVEVAAKGTEEQLAVLEAFLAVGPGSADVENVEKRSIPHEDIEDNQFSIR